MKKIKLTTVLLVVLMLGQIFSTCVSAADNVVNTTIESVSANAALLSTAPSIDEALPKGNLLTFSRFNSDNVLRYWSSEGVTLSYDEDVNGGYLRVTAIPQSHVGAFYKPGDTISAGKYLFTGYFRTLREGALTELRIILRQTDTTSHIAWAYPTNDWLKVEFYVELTDELEYIRVCGGPNPIMTQDYCFDQFSLVPVEEIPENATDTFGKKVTADEVEASMGETASEVWSWDPEVESQYEIEGIVLNHDFSGFLDAASTNLITEAQIEEFARQYVGTHITDYYISVNDVCSMYPTNGGTMSYLDKYYQKIENGIPVDYSEVGQAKGSYYLYETLAVDPIGVLSETFREVGINPWLTFRMNDVHSMTAETTSIIFSDFYHNHPEIRRVQHHNYVTYFDYAMDYTHELVREYMLKFINDTLARYDTYGIELDFQREMWLWHIGGEYNGLEILTDFVRDVNDIVAIYEEKYGHDIKIATSVAYDVATNYAYGLDVITWMSEGLIDWLVPSCRHGSTDTDIPVKMWDAITESYDVVLAIRIDPTQLRSHPLNPSKKMDIESISAAAASAFSQGADKIYLFNYYKSSTNFFTDADKFNTTDPDKATMWTILGTVGSYEKLMQMNRRSILSYRDMTPLWENTVQYLPKTINNSQFQTFRIPVGDVVDGSKLMVKFSVSKNNPIENPPVVYVNSKPCEYVGIDLCRGGYTDNMLMCYNIPESEYGDTYMVIEIMASTATSFETDYMEVYVQAPAMKH
ncbi:MAG: hypothetical protein IJY93_06525 [Clostridia bacterium]|nr:hypothetical protein [Clostridia bacterium]